MQIRLTSSVSFNESRAFPRINPILIRPTVSSAKHGGSWWAQDIIGRIESSLTRITVLHVAFSALTLLAGRHREHPACKIGVGVVSTDLSGARCRLFAYGPADACHCIPKPYLLLPHLNPDWFNLFGTIYPDCHGKKAVKRGCSSNSSSK